MPKKEKKCKRVIIFSDKPKYFRVVKFGNKQILLSETEKKKIKKKWGKL